ncbi:hypothetical protein GCK32_004856 [Trichostrongylus colubriformis]|uniref:Uncharacterized protein n=1 Tax=Trichostrongylus colubriformis TaxID=6319 RepID=A0AAN8EXT9_TRICO
MRLRALESLSLSREGNARKEIHSHCVRLLSLPGGKGDMTIGGTEEGCYRVDYNRNGLLEELLRRKWSRRAMSKAMQELRDLATIVDWSKMVYMRHRSEKLHLNKRFWLELLKWQDIENTLCGEPRLIGYGFQKNEIAVSRQLLAADPEHKFVSRYGLKLLDVCYRAHQWADLGYDATEELTRRTQRCRRVRELSTTGVCVGADFKDFNSCHRLRDMSNDYSLMGRIFHTLWKKLGSTEEVVQD